MPQISPGERRRAIRWGVSIFALLLVLVILLSTLAPFADYLWYLHDARQPQVFTLAYATRGILFLPAFLLTWAVLHFSLKRALRLSLVYLEVPASTGQMLLSNALHFVQERGWNLVRILAPVLAFLSASGFSAEWNTYLLASHAQSFGIKDPLFGLDLGFFVFTLPWYRAMVNYLFGVLLLTTILTVAIYAGLQLMAAMAKVELGRPNIRLHIGILTGLTILVLAAQIYLKTYDFGLAANAQFTGAGYTAHIQLWIQRALAGLVALFGLSTIVISRSQAIYRFLLQAGITLVALAVVGLAIVPAVIQNVIVEPDKLHKEGQFAERAIKMTRFAYGLDKISARDFPVQDTPTPASLAQSKATLDNMRLWDPEIVRQSIEILQGFKPYYRFNDVDIDRYVIDGKPTEVMLSPRDIDLDGLSPNARTWVNERLQYTHGFGVVMTSVNSSTADGEPSFLIRDIPPVSLPDIPFTQPRIYYSDFRDESGTPTNEYALVNSNQPEFDYPAQDKEQTNRWEGKGGIPIGSFFRRLALSIVLGDGNLLVSGNVTPETRLLMHRSILDRCARTFPFLKLDNDPYIVLIGGKVYWILDAYTTTSRMPYSDLAGDVNYIRNSVKIVIDAYTGETTAYAIDPGEPILATYRSIYPGLIQDASRLPAGFREHFRYPEDMFRLQAGELAQYHVTDPFTFLNNNDAWEMPRERGLGGSESPLAPYYVEMTLPNESKDGFVLMLPFTPRNKPNMSGWLAAHCDPSRYGQMVLYNFAKGANVAGAEQMESKFATDAKVNAAILQLRGGGQTDVVLGNMLVIPIGQSVMYAESLFPKSSSSGLQSMPLLKKVILGLNNRIEIGDSYAEALQKLFGSEPPPAQPAEPPAPGTSSAVPSMAKVRQAADLLDRADAALRSGDFAKYGELQRKARALLRQTLSSDRAGASGPGPTPGPAD